MEDGRHDGRILARLWQRGTQRLEAAAAMSNHHVMADAWADRRWAGACPPAGSAALFYF